MSRSAGRHTPGPWRVGDAGHTVFGPNLGKTSDTISPFVRAANLMPVSRIVASNLARSNAARIVACVNALEGKDPDAIGELIEAADEALLSLTFILEEIKRQKIDPSTDLGCAMDLRMERADRLRAALAALEGSK